MSDKMMVIKDGDHWVFVLPDFKNLQVSPAEIADKNSFQNQSMDLIYRNLQLDQQVCNAKAAIDALHQQARQK